MTDTWTDHYYSALEFFFWEPQHLGRSKSAKSSFRTPAAVFKHLRKMEVTLNHNLQQFLSLAPAALQRRLFTAMFGRDLDLAFTLHGRRVGELFKLENCMQPDVVFTALEATVAIEMKLESKSSLQQVMKYGVLALAVELADEARREHYFALLGAGRFEDQWRKKYVTQEALRVDLAATDAAEFLRKMPPRFRERADRFAEILGTMHLAFINYETLAAVLTEFAAGAEADTLGAEMLRNLVTGMTKELRIRELIT